MVTGLPLAETLQAWVEMVNRAMEGYLQPGSAWPPRLAQAMQYTVSGGGKRIRPLLALLANDACGGTLEEALPAACAVEFVHTYSLIHDDLPAMDDDDLRRGQPTCHRQFDEATAILAGDAMLSLSFEILGEMQPASAAVACVKELASASGPQGMVGGQIDDLSADPETGDIAWLESMHGRKTGKLLIASLRMGAIAGGARPRQLEALTEFGRCLGLAFQITDDLLDVEGSAEQLGKHAQKDLAAGKLTYPGLLGVEESRNRALRLAHEAKEHVDVFGSAGQRLRQLADFIVERDH